MYSEADNDLAGHVFLISGGGSGIGRATCLKAAARGAKVLVLDRDAAAAETTLSGMVGNGHAFERADVTDRAQVWEAVSRLTTSIHLTSIVVSAGIAQPRGIDDITESDLIDTFSCNVFGAIYCIQAALPRLAVEKKNKSIVLVSSVAALVGGGLFGGSHYAASKAALDGLGRALSRELAPHIRVNQVSPGPTNTPIIKDLDEEGRRLLSQRSLLKRIAEPEEIANAVLWLAGPESCNVTGHTLNVSGGAVLG